MADEPSTDHTPDAKTIFVVDDDPALRDALRWLIESGGYTVETFVTAEDFLERYDPHRAGCLLLDVRLPGMSGLALQQELGVRKCELPIIIMSGHADVAMAVRALKLGAIDFIEKPFRHNLLLERLAEILQWTAPVGPPRTATGAGEAGRLVELETECERLRARVSELEDTLAAAQEKERIFADRLEVLQRVAARLTIERNALDSRTQALLAAGQQLDAEKRAGLAAAHERVTEIEGELAVLRAELDEVRSASPTDAALDAELPAAVPDEPPWPAPVEPAPVATPSVETTVAIIDGSELADALVGTLRERGYAPTRLDPERDLEAQLAAGATACVLLNLAAPALWRAAPLLQGGDSASAPPIIAYAVRPGAHAGFWFGPITFAHLPWRDMNVLEVLNRMGAGIKRVMVMGNDMDGMSALRAQLKGAGVSAALVFDARQLLDLLPSVRPQAAILHVSPTTADVFRAIGGLRGAVGEIPMLLLLDAVPTSREEAFLRAGVHLLSNQSTVDLDDLTRRIATCLVTARVPVRSPDTSPVA